MKKLYFIILGILIFSFGCEKAEEYSEIPYINYKDFTFDVVQEGTLINQVGFLSFEFVDGDGDIGFYDNSDSIESEEIYDGFVYGYTKQNGSFVLTDTTEFVMPYLEEGTYTKYKKGEIQLKIYLVNRVGDTIKYDFQIMDRKYHLSNLGSTPELVVPEWN